MKSTIRQGFTLIELIVVIAILAILASILIPLVTDYIQSSKDAKNEANCSSLYRLTINELLLDQSPSIGVSEAEPSEDTGFMSITYTVNTPTKILTSFSCSVDGWSHTEK